MAKNKKSNNPFKVWGSWIGLIFFIYLYATTTCHGGEGSTNCNPTLNPKDILENIKLVNFNPSVLFYFVFLIPLILGVIGFFIGYGIHLLIRKLSTLVH